MAPVIRISDATYDKLKLIAEPFVDTPDAVIGRCLDVVLEARGILPAETKRNGDGLRRLDPRNPGELRHTSVKRVVIDDEEISRPSWNQLLRELHVVALEALGDFDNVRKMSPANVRRGRYEEEGFHYVPPADLSIQGQDSNQAWAKSLQMAEKLGVSLGVWFRWQEKKGAAHPGEEGRILWSPTKR